MQSIERDKTRISNSFVIKILIVLVILIFSLCYNANAQIIPCNVQMGGIVLSDYNGYNISCLGYSDGQIDVNPTGGIPPYSYSWSSVNGYGLTSANKDQSGLTAGTYDVIVTDAVGCSANSSVTLIEPTEIISNISSSSYPSGDNISCNGMNDGTIDLEVFGGSPGYSYSWTTPDGSGLIVTDEDQNGLSAGVYSVEITDLNSCGNKTDITLIEPMQLMGFIGTITNMSGYNFPCSDMNNGLLDLSIIGSTPGYTYLWSTLNGSGLNPTNQDQFTVGAGTYNVITTDTNGCTLTNTVTLTAPPALDALILASIYPSGTNISCYGLADGSIDLNITGGTAGYSFEWSTPNGSGLNIYSEDQSGLTAGNYEVVVTDANDCVLKLDIELREPDVLTSTLFAPTYLSDDNISCNGSNDGSIDLSVFGGSPSYTFLWSGSNGGLVSPTSEDQSSLAAGTYNVLITDTNGCQISNSIDLIEPSSLNMTSLEGTFPSGSNISCNGLSDGSIDINASGGSPGYSYNWTSLNDSSFIEIAEDQSGLGAGVYTVTITDINGCQITSDITLIEPTAFALYLNSTTFPSGDNISCYGSSDGMIDLNVSGSSPGYSFEWQTNDGGNLNPLAQNQNSITTGTYVVIVSDINGCITTDSITLIEPSQLMASSLLSTYPSGDHISCFEFNDGSIDLFCSGGSATYNFNWTTANGSGLAFNAQNQSGLTSGNYDVLIIDTNGCELNVSIFLSEPEELTVNIDFISDFFGLPVSCVGQSDGILEAIANGGSPIYNYTWNTSPTQNTANISDLSEGFYSISVEDINACTAMDSTTLIGNPLPVIHPNPAESYCDGELIQLNSNTTENESCHWELSNGMSLDQCNNNQFYIDQIGCVDAQITVTNEMGCSDSLFLKSYICINPVPEASFTSNNTNPTTIDNTVLFENTSTGANYFEWAFGDGEFSEDANPSHVFPGNQPDEYETILYAFNDFGCSDSAMMHISVKEELFFYVPNSFTPDGNEHNPIFNPVFGSGYSQEDYNLMIFNRWGETVFESMDMSVGWDGTYNGSQAESGIYIWRMILRIGEKTKADELKKVYTGHINLIR